MPFYVSTWRVDGTAPVCPGEFIDLGSLTTRNRGEQNYALVWSDTPQSVPGVFFVADQPGDRVANPVVNTINTTLGTDVARDTLANVVLRLLRDYPHKWPQPPIDNQGMVRITLGPLDVSVDQDDDPVHFIDPWSPDSDPNAVRPVP